MNRAILLQTEATDSKKTVLSDFLNRATREVNRILPLRQGYKNASEFQTEIASGLKANAGFNVQVICDIARSTSGKQKTCIRVRGTTVKFNVPRNCKTFKTKRFSFVEFGLYPRRRLAIPIKKNRNWDRLSGLIGSGWICKTYGLTPSLEVVAYLSKESMALPPRRNVLGIDINAKGFAYTVLTPEGRVLRQGYLGRQIWPKKVHFADRRAILQSLNALKRLKRMRHRQRNYVKTNIAQLVREVVLLAKKYDADRKASLAVAVKTFLERYGLLNQNPFQISGRRVPVSGLQRNVSDALESMAVPVPAQGRGKLTGFSGG